MGGVELKLTVAGRVVGEYRDGVGVERSLGVRPYLHPLRTLAGTVVSDAFPEDHRWHLGLSLAVQDVNRNNLWGGRTYVRDRGYTWLDDHGAITSEGFDEVRADGFVERLAWRGADGKVLLRERRTVAAAHLDERAWVLELGWELSAEEEVVLGSPATNGRPGGAGYGGCFWRVAPGANLGLSAGELSGEEQVNGSVEPELVWRGESGGAAYTLVFSGLGDGDRWFVRTSEGATGYPGVCQAWAYEQPRVIGAGETRTGSLRVVISD
ncbi:PmoA family protein [Saccharothrix algeriensis]|uniref:Oxidoreductase n=1 Tax=Catellatospora bangladeshensis TaxID=310355 RepID=A0A8J3NKI0_9ACTN|nr:oxidoreductase [Catellatospora bangladeshensis]